MAAAVLETFLGGMETGFPLRGPSDGGDLETFLGGMETDGALNASYSGEGP